MAISGKKPDINIEKKTFQAAYEMKLVYYFTRNQRNLYFKMPVNYRYSAGVTSSKRHCPAILPKWKLKFPSLAFSIIM